MKFLRFQVVPAVIIAAIALSFPGRADDVLMLTQNWAMPTLLNPAATGEIDYIRIRGGARLEWLGLHQSPKNFVGTADAPFKVFGKRIGTGVMVNSESYFLYRNLQVGAQGSYKINIKKSTLSIGIQLGYYHSKFKGSELKLSDIAGDSDNSETDNNGVTDEMPLTVLTRDDIETDGSQSSSGADDLPTQDVKAGAFDVGIGIRYNHPYFYVGVAGIHLTNPTLKMTVNGETTTDTHFLERKLPASLYFDAGGNIPIHNSLFTLQPSLQIASDFKNFASVIEMRATYNNRLSFGLDYRWNQAVGVMAAFSFKNFFVGYSWEYDYTESAKKSTGNHELVLGYQFKLDMGGKQKFSHRSIRIM